MWFCEDISWAKFTIQKNGAQEKRLEKGNWKVDYVLSHTTPKKYIPEEALLPEHPWYVYDERTEVWLDTLEDKLEYEAWLCGHFHINKDVEKVHFLFGRYFKLL